MKILSVKKLEEGMILGKDIYTEDGRVMLHEDVVLNKMFIKSLGEKGVPCVYIKDVESREVEVVEIIDMTLKVKAVQTVKQIIDDLAPSKGIVSRKNTKCISKKSIVDTRNIIFEIMDNMRHNDNVLVRIVEMMGTDVHLYSHSVNVAILSLVIGTEILEGTNTIEKEKKLVALGLGAMLHDIGKVMLPSNILNKTESLTPEELKIYQQHPVIGYELLKDNAEINSMAYHGIIKGCALLHHENLDGSGYPYGWNGSQLEDYVRIIRVADLYSNMARSWGGRGRFSPPMALEKISSMCFKRVDPHVFTILKEHLALYPEGSCVLLSSGEKALVTRNNELHSDRPIVKVVRGADGKPYRGFKVIDMMKDLSYLIMDSVDLD